MDPLAGFCIDCCSPIEVTEKVWMISSSLEVHCQCCEEPTKTLLPRTIMKEIPKRKGSYAHFDINLRSMLIAFGCGFAGRTLGRILAFLDLPGCLLYQRWYGQNQHVVIDLTLTGH